jgi:hypothetical protein
VQGRTPDGLIAVAFNANDNRDKWSARRHPVEGRFWFYRSELRRA